jgi:ABC-type transport system substrate-binding protein
VVEERGDDFNWAPVGTGPMIMKDVVPDRGLTLERYPDYWKPGLPYLDSVVWEIGLDPELAILRIESGEQDMMYDAIPTATYDELRGDPNLSGQVVVGDEAQIFYLTLSMKHDALQNQPVREALAMAIDKERLVRVLKGLANPANGGLLGPYSPSYQDGLAYPYDPEGAKEALAAAGYPDGFDVTVWGQNTTPFAEMGQTVEQDLSALGLNVDLQLMESDAFYALSVENPDGILEFSWGLSYPHASYIMDSAFTEAALDAGCCNYSAWVNPEFDELAAEAHIASDEQEINDLYKQMDSMVVKDEVVWIPMLYGKRADFVSSRVRGFEIPTSGDGSEKYFEKYWVEAA